MSTWVGAAQPDDVCSVIESQKGAQISENDFARITGADLGSECRQTRNLDGSIGQVCFSAYQYRSAPALNLFQQLKSQIEDCDGAKVIIPASSPVNHPDTYEQSIVEFDDFSVSIALKDKAALNQTILFLRIEPK